MLDFVRRPKLAPAAVVLAIVGGMAVGPVAASAGTVAIAATAKAPNLPVLTQPANTPTDENANVPIVQIGSLAIPKIGLVTPIYEGIYLSVINHGPGHWPGSAMPGGFGNMVLAGHRVTHSHPFRHIDALVAGDQIIVSDSTGIYTYAVTGSRVVTPQETWIADQNRGYEITLFACHPPGSAEYRYVVTGKLVATQPPAPPA